MSSKTKTKPPCNLPVMYSPRESTTEMSLHHSLMTEVYRAVGCKYTYMGQAHGMGKEYTSVLGPY